MRPTPRATLLFGLGVPLSLLLVLIDERLWPVAMAYIGGAVVVTGIDGILCTPWRAFAVEPQFPGLLYVGERDALVVRIGPPARRTIVELACDVGPELVSPPVRSGTLAPGEPADLTIPLVPKRRGGAALDRLWLRWYGPLGLMARQRTHDLFATLPIVPNIRAVQRAALRFSARHAMHGVRAQIERGAGSEFEALREYVAGLDHRWIDVIAQEQALGAWVFRAPQSQQHHGQGHGQKWQHPRPVTWTRTISLWTWKRSSVSTSA